MFTKNDLKSKNTETILTYLEDPDTLEYEVKVVDIINEYLVITDSTPFYVKGGGQQADSGYLYAGKEMFEVISVNFSLEGRVAHSLIMPIAQTIFVGDTVRLSVDHSKRMRNSAIHTAGELICAAVKVLGYNWPVVSAIHYTDNASIEFDSALHETVKQQFVQKLQRQLDEMIQTGFQVQTSFHSERDDVIATCGYFPDYIPAGERIRVVKVWPGVYCRPCAGTHLKNINLLGRVEITKVKNKKGGIQIRYLTS